MSAVIRLRHARDAWPASPIAKESRDKIPRRHLAPGDHTSARQVFAAETSSHRTQGAALGAAGPRAQWTAKAKSRLAQRTETTLPRAAAPTADRRDSPQHHAPAHSRADLSLRVSRQRGDQTTIQTMALDRPTSDSTPSHFIDDGKGRRRFARP